MYFNVDANSGRALVETKKENIINDIKILSKSNAFRKATNYTFNININGRKYTVKYDNKKFIDNIDLITEHLLKCCDMFDKAPLFCNVVHNNSILNGNATLKIRFDFNKHDIKTIVETLEEIHNITIDRRPVIENNNIKINTYLDYAVEILNLAAELYSNLHYTNKEVRIKYLNNINNKLHIIVSRGRNKGSYKYINFTLDTISDINTIINNTDLFFANDIYILNWYLDVVDDFRVYDVFKFETDYIKLKLAISNENEYDKIMRLIDNIIENKVDFITFEIMDIEYACTIMLSRNEKYHILINRDDILNISPKDAKRLFKILSYSEGRDDILKDLHYEQQMNGKQVYTLNDIFNHAAIEMV